MRHKIITPLFIATEITLISMLLMEHIPLLNIDTIFSVAVGGLITIATGTGVHLWEASKARKNELASAATEIRDILATYHVSLREADKHIQRSYENWEDGKTPHPIFMFNPSFLIFGEIKIPTNGVSKLYGHIPVIEVAKISGIRFESSILNRRIENILRTQEKLFEEFVADAFTPYSPERGHGGLVMTRATGKAKLIEPEISELRRVIYNLLDTIADVTDALLPITQRKNWK